MYTFLASELSGGSEFIAEATGALWRLQSLQVVPAQKSETNLKLLHN